jgi:hypothetical protein
VTWGVLKDAWVLSLSRLGPMSAWFGPYWPPQSSRQSMRRRR